MEKYYCCYKANTELKFNPVDKIKEQIEKTDRIVKYLIKLRKDIAPKYVRALIKRLQSVVNGYTVEINSKDFQDLNDKLTSIKIGETLANLIIYYMAKSLEIQDKSEIKSENAIFTSLNRSKSMEGLSYYRVKAFADVLGKDEGIKLYSKILGLVVTETNKDLKINEKNTVKIRNEYAVKNWCKEGVGDFTFTFINENQVLYRFDRCVTHEALKDFNDPDIAYIASCYLGDIPEFNEPDFIHLRRTQTLHHGDFCDELYWDTRVHKEHPKQPSLEFTKELAKEVKEK